MEHPTIHAVVSSARAVVSTVHGVDSRSGRGLKGFVQGMLDVGLGGLCKEIAQKVAKNAQKVKEKKGPSLAHHAGGQQDKPKSEGEGQLWVLGGVHIFVLSTFNNTQGTISLPKNATFFQKK